jgi:hypothetical protein
MGLEVALEACDEAVTASELSYSKIADQSSVLQSTLSRQHRRVCASREERYSSQRRISPQQEHKL